MEKSFLFIIKYKSNIFMETCFYHWKKKPNPKKQKVV